MENFDKYPYAAFIHQNFGGKNPTLNKPVVIDASFLGTAHILTTKGIFYYHTDCTVFQILDDLKFVLKLNDDLQGDDVSSIIEIVTNALSINEYC